MVISYTVVFENRSSRAGTICIYQEDPAGPGFPSALAWLCQDVEPGGELTFQWTLDYAFVWGETGELVPGVIFEPAQIIPCDPFATNAIFLSAKNGPVQFVEPPYNGQIGMLTISADGTVPIDRLSMGIRLAGADALVQQVIPLLSFRVTTAPRYWIALGDFTPGEVLDTTILTDKAVLAFPPDVYRLLVTLDGNGSWIVVSRQG